MTPATKLNLEFFLGDELVVEVLCQDAKGLAMPECVAVLRVYQKGVGTVLDVSCVTDSGANAVFDIGGATEDFTPGVYRYIATAISAAGGAMHTQQHGSLNARFNAFKAYTFEPPDPPGEDDLALDTGATTQTVIT